MKMVRVDLVDKELENIVSYRKKLTPHKFISKQNVVGDLIVKESNRINKITSKEEE